MTNMGNEQPINLTKGHNMAPPTQPGLAGTLGWPGTPAILGRLRVNLQHFADRQGQLHSHKFSPEFAQYHQRP